MYYPEFLKALEHMPIVTRVIRWRKRGKHNYKSALLIPIITTEGTIYHMYFNHWDKEDEATKKEDIFIISSWPVEDCIKIMSVLYTYNGEIIGEV